MRRIKTKHVSAIIAVLVIFAAVVFYMIHMRYFTIWVMVKGFEDDNVEFTHNVNFVPIVKFRNGDITIWQTYGPALGVGGRFPRYDLMHHPHLVTKDGCALESRRLFGAVRYGFAARRYRNSDDGNGYEIDNRTARVYWITPEELNAAISAGELCLPAYEDMDTFDMRKIKGI